MTKPMWNDSKATIELQTNTCGGYRYWWYNKIKNQSGFVNTYDEAKMLAGVA